MKRSAILYVLLLCRSIGSSQAIDKISIEGVEMENLIDIDIYGTDYFLLCGGHDSQLYLIKYNSENQLVWFIKNAPYNNTPKFKVGKERIYLLFHSTDSTEFISYSLNGDELYHLNFKNTKIGYSEYDHFEQEQSNHIIIYQDGNNGPIQFPHYLILDENGNILSEYIFEKETVRIGRIKEDLQKNIFLTIDYYSEEIDPELEYLEYRYTSLLKISKEGTLIWEIDPVSETAPVDIEFDIENRIILFADNYKIKIEPESLLFTGEKIYESESNSSVFHYYTCNGLEVISYDFTNDLIHCILFDPDEPYESIHKTAIPFPGSSIYQELNQYQFDSNGYVSALIESYLHTYDLVLFDINGNLIMNTEIFSYSLTDGISSVKYKIVNGRIILFYTQDEDPGNTTYNNIYRKAILPGTPNSNILADCKYFSPCENMFIRYDETRKLIFVYIPELTSINTLNYYMYDLSGRLVQYAESGSEAELDVTGLTRGLYIITAKNGSDIICATKILVN